MYEALCTSMERHSTSIIHCCSTVYLLHSNIYQVHMYMFMVLVLGTQVHSTTRHIYNVQVCTLHNTGLWHSHTARTQPSLPVFVASRESREMNMNFKKVQALCTGDMYYVLV